MDCINKLIFIFLIFCSFSAHSYSRMDSPFFAADIDKIIRSPVGSNAKFIIDTSYIGTNSAGKKMYVKAPVPFSKGVVGKLMRAKAFTPQGMAVTAAMLAAGWLVDEALENFFQESGEPIIDDTIGKCLSGARPFSNLGNLTINDCAVRINATYWCSDTGSHTWDADTNGACQPVTGGEPPEEITKTYAEPEDYADNSPALSYPDLEDVFMNPYTAKPDSDVDTADDSDTNPTLETDPFKTIGDALTEGYDLENDDDPNTNADDLPTLDDPNSLDDPNYTEDKPQQDDPIGLCDEYPNIVACVKAKDLIGNFVEAPEILEVEVPFSFSAVALNTNAVCPVSSSNTLSNGMNFSFNNQPVCDFASGIKFIILSVCSILSLYIVAGGVKNG